MVLDEQARVQEQLKGPGVQSEGGGKVGGGRVGRSCRPAGAFPCPGPSDRLRDVCDHGHMVSLSSEFCAGNTGQS